MFDFWFPSLLGGALLGAASLLMLLGLGRITGVSGILLQAIKVADGRVWRLSFLLGLAGGVFVYQITAQNTELAPYAPHFELSTIWYAIAGLLVGLGTGIGSGCTSGHGVCGVSRLSARSITAVTVFMLVAVITASLFHGIAGGQ